MEAGLTDHVWSLDELIGQLPETKPNGQADKELAKKALQRGNYGKEPNFNPYLDPNVQHVGISRLRALNVTQLREQIRRW